jgi:hypothetical protein
MNETTTVVPSRRDFAKALAVLAAAMAVPAAAQDAAAPDAKAYAEALNVVIRYRFGKHLSDERLKKVQASVLRGRFNSDALKNVKLANGDDPIAAFRADLP